MTASSLNLNTNTLTIRHGSIAMAARILIPAWFSIVSSAWAGFSTNNQLSYTWNNSSSTYNWASGLTVPNNQWTFVALVVTAGNATLYMQPLGGAMQTATNAVANTANAFSGTTYIGEDFAGGRLFDGTIDDVRIYTSSLSAASIASVAAVTPTVATAAAASPSPITATTTAFSVLGADASGAANLTYTWAATSLPADAYAHLSVNGSNAAQNSVATFSAGALTQSLQRSLTAAASSRQAA